MIINFIAVGSKGVPVKQGYMMHRQNWIFKRDLAVIQEMAENFDKIFDIQKAEHNSGMHVNP